MLFSDTIMQIPVERIKANPYQPRKIFDEEGLLDLAESIKEVGIIQPITVRVVDDHYEIVVGERRFRASKMAELEFISAIVVDIKDEESAVVALIENLQRQDLNFIEEAEALQMLMEKHGFNQKDLAIKIGKNQSTVSNKIRILGLPDSIKDFLVTHDLTERHGRALLKLKSEKDMIKVIKAIIKDNLTVKATEQLIEKKLEEASAEPIKKQTLKYNINYKIYLNTVKQAYEAILKTGSKVKYLEKDKGDYVEVTIRIPKEKV